MSIASRLEEKIKNHLNPIDYKVRDDSHKHEGHTGHDGQGESHFYVMICSDVFKDQSRVTRQRMIYDLFSEEMDERIHALSLKLLTKDEN